MNGVIGNKQGLSAEALEYPTQATSTVLVSPAANQQLYVHDITAYNATSSAMDIGLGFRYAAAAWKLYTVGASNVDVTALIQAGSAVNLFDTTNNHGVIIQNKGRFGLIIMDISQAQTGSPVYQYQYWNGGWTSLTVNSTPVYTGTGYVALAFVPPVDWVQGNGSAVATLANGNAGYCLKILATSAPSQAVQITDFQLAKLWAYRNITAKGSVSVRFEMHPKLLESGEALQPFFATADVRNSVEFSYQEAP